MVMIIDESLPFSVALHRTGYNQEVLNERLRKEVSASEYS